MTQIMDGSSDILPRVLPQPSNSAVRLGHPDIPNSSSWTGGSGPSHFRITFSHHWTSLRKGGLMIRRWRCNNMESFVNENQVRTSEIFDYLMARLIGVSRSAVPSPGLFRESDPPSLKESSRSQVFPFSPSRVQECQEADFKPEGRICQASATHCHHLVCRLVAELQCIPHGINDL